MSAATARSTSAGNRTSRIGPVLAADIQARLVERLLERHAVVDQERQHLRHRRHDAPAAGGAEREPGRAIAAHDHRAHVGERPPARRDRVGPTRPRIEPEDAVVHEDAGLRQHHLGAEARKQRLRQRGHVAVAIDHAEMGGAGRRRRALAQAFEPGRIGLREGIGIGRVGRRTRPGRELGIPQRSRQPPQHIRQGRAAAQARHGRHTHAAIGDVERRHDRGAIAAQIGSGQPAAALLQIPQERGRHLALVEVARAGLGQTAQRARQIAERQMAGPFHRRHRRQAARQIDRARGRELRQFARRDGDAEGRIPVQRQAALGQRDGRLQRLPPADAAEPLERQPHALDLAGHGDRVIALEVAILLHRRPGEQGLGRAAGERIVGRIERRRRDHGEVDDLGRRAVGLRHHHEAAAAEPVHPGLDDSGGEPGGHGRIDGVAAGSEHAGADGGSQPTLRGDDAMGRLHDRLARRQRGGIGDLHEQLA